MKGLNRYGGEGRVISVLSLPVRVFLCYRDWVRVRWARWVPVPLLVLFLPLLLSLALRVPQETPMCPTASMTEHTAAAG